MHSSVTGYFVSSFQGALRRLRKLSRRPQPVAFPAEGNKFVGGDIAAATIVPEAAEQAPIKLLALGTCAVSTVLSEMQGDGLTIDHRLFDNYAHSVIPEVERQGYDALIISFTLRHIFGDATKQLVPNSYPINCIYWPRAVAEGREQEYLDTCAMLIEQQVDRLCAALGGQPIFFFAFIEPKHNYLGNLLPRYHLSNPAFFVQKLNESLERSIAKHAAAYFFDVNEIIALIGSARIQDDYVQQIAHASYLWDDYVDKDRLAPSAQPSQMYRFAEPLRELGKALGQRLRDDLAIVRHPLQIKAIIVDLDDTLWRGVAADDDRPDYEFTEGWPLGVAEALLIFKARGGLLAICSKNDGAVIEQRFEQIYHGRLRLDDFASMRINFERKSANIAGILADLNILEENALFIDDNPREAAEVQSAFPNLRIYCTDHYDWRRRILMSPDTQVAYITEEAALRTQSIQAKVQREQVREQKTPEEWLESLELVQDYVLVRDTGDQHFARAFELLNKTNQFNTTGKRWSQDEVENHFDAGGYLLCSFLRDRLVNNGLIGVVVVSANEIVQIVLSCRVFNLQSEYATGHMVCELILKDYPEVVGKIIDTGKNFTCHEYFTKLGFAQCNGAFVCRDVPEHPPYLKSQPLSISGRGGAPLKRLAS